MKKTLVLGASLNPSRYSNLAIHRLVNNDIEVEAIGLREGEVAGVLITSEKRPLENIDTITLYLNAKRQEEYYDYIVSLKPNRVIFNHGTENMELVELLQNHDIHSEIACTLVLLGTKQY